jgi:hypothetical protein
LTGWGWPGGREEKVVAGAPGWALDTREVESCARAVSSVAARAALVLPPVGREGGSSAAGVLAVGALGLGSMPGTVMAWEVVLAVVEAVVEAEATLVRMERRAAVVGGVGAPVELVAEKWVRMEDTPDTAAVERDWAAVVLVVLVAVVALEGDGSWAEFPTNTADAVASGVLAATAGAIAGMIHNLQQIQKQPVQLLVSGGNSPLLIPRLSALGFSPHYERDLVLQGIALISAGFEE